LFQVRKNYILEVRRNSQLRCVFAGGDDYSGVPWDVVCLLCLSILFHSLEDEYVFVTAHESLFPQENRYCRFQSVGDQDSSEPHMPVPFTFMPALPLSRHPAIRLFPSSLSDCTFPLNFLVTLPHHIVLFPSSNATTNSRTN